LNGANIKKKKVVITEDEQGLEEEMSR